MSACVPALEFRDCTGTLAASVPTPPDRVLRVDCALLTVEADPAQPGLGRTRIGLMRVGLADAPADRPPLLVVGDSATQPSATGAAALAGQVPVELLRRPCPAANWGRAGRIGPGRSVWLIVRRRSRALDSLGLRYRGRCHVDPARLDALAGRLRDRYGDRVRTGATDSAGYGIVADATPMGMREGDPLPVDVDRLKPDTFVGDMITKPAVSPLIAAARQAGCGTSTGGDMFAAVSCLIVDVLIEDGPLS